MVVTLPSLMLTASAFSVRDGGQGREGITLGKEQKARGAG